MALYTICSRGVPIGVSDLSFLRIGGPNRSGYLMPNAEGERLLPALASVLPAMRAWMHRDVDFEGQPSVQPHLFGSSLFADLAEAFHHLDGQELTLHREDGTVIPTEVIGIQDTEQLRSLSEWDDAFAPVEEEESDAEEAFYHIEFNDDVDAETREAFLREVEELSNDLLLDDMQPWESPEWLLEEIEYPQPEFPRYQVHVRVIDERDVP